MVETNDELKPSLDDWVDFAGDFLKAELVKEWPIKLVAINVDTEFDKDEKARLFITTECFNKTWRLELNKTNQAILKLNKIEAPNQIKGKTLTFEKIMVRNPSLKKQVPSFLLAKVE